jgi:hypothetical protein
MSVLPPRFAVVGHPNKGKSSIVATLAEDDSVQISQTPGTTRLARRYPMRVDGEVLYELIDTPGFQRAREVVEWLRSHERGVNLRPAVLAEFVAQHGADPRFVDECELLRPLIEGAGILYVVDGAHPYGPEYEAEMEILRWSGRPRMALINLIGPGDHVAEWRHALDQFFAIVRVFDAVHADFAKRIDLLRAFGELHEAWSAHLKRAAETLVAERMRRRRRAAEEIAALLCDALTATRRGPAPQDPGDRTAAKRLLEALKRDIRQRELAARRQVQELYQHGTVQVEERATDLLDADVFSARTFSVFGLSNAQLALTGAASGAAAFGGVDLALGGASLGLVSLLGALAGGATALFGAGELAKVRVLGQSIGGYVLVVGPVTARNFPWVLLGRALTHHRLVAERNHARREGVILDVAARGHLADEIDPARRRRLEALFDELRDERDPDLELRRSLSEQVDDLLAHPTDATPARGEKDMAPDAQA